MNEALVAVAAALVGAGAGILGAWINAHSLRQQVRNQAVVEHGHWRRQSRFDAYHEFIGVAFAALELLETNRMEASDLGHLVDPDSLKDADRTLWNASTKVLLAGPELMSDFARRICAEYRSARDMLVADPIVPRGDDKWQTVGESLFDLMAVFPLAARKVLDAPTPDEIPYPNDVLPTESAD